MSHGREERRKADGSRDRAVHLNRPSDENNNMAAAAEEFVAWQYGLETNPAKHPDKWDIRLKGNKRIFDVDVKWTQYDNGQLISPVAGRWKNDIYVLVTGWWIADFRLRGFEWGHTLREHVRDLGYGATYVMSQDEIKPNVDMLMAGFSTCPGPAPRGRDSGFQEKLAGAMID